MAQPAPHPGGASRLKSVSTYGVEVVRRAPTTVLRLMDRGQAMDTAGIKGVLTVLSGGTQRDVALMPLGENQLEAKLQLEAGTDAVLVLTLPDQRVVTVGFTAP